MTLTPENLAAMRAAASAATPGEWGADRFETEDGHGRYFAYQVFDAKGHEIFGSENCHYLAAEMQEEYDEDGGCRWDEGARKNAEHVALSCPANVLALLDMLLHSEERRTKAAVHFCDELAVLLARAEAAEARVAELEGQGR